DPHPLPLHDALPIYCCRPAYRWFSYPNVTTQMAMQLSGLLLFIFAQVRGFYVCADFEALISLNNESLSGCKRLSLIAAWQYYGRSEEHTSELQSREN